MLPFRANWHRLDSRFLALSLRERMLIIVMTVAVLAASAEFVIFSTLRDQTATEKRQQVDNQQQREQLQNELAQLQAWHAGREDSSRLDSVQQQLSAVDNQIRQLSQRMVPPDQMSALLQQLLSRETGLQVVALSKLPMDNSMRETQTQTTAISATASPIATGHAQLYRHRMRLSLRGSYFDSLHYLQAMEALPWTVYWDSLDYQVEQYPQGVLTVEIATLGQEAGWLGG